MADTEGGETFLAHSVAFVMVVEGVDGVVNRANETDPDALVCYFIGRHVGGRLTLASERTSDGTRAVLVFEKEAAARAFLIVEGLGPGWQAIGGVRHCALNLPTALTRGEEESTMVPIRNLEDHLQEA